MNNNVKSSNIVAKKLFYIGVVFLSLLVVAAIVFFEFTDGALFETPEPVNPVLDVADGELLINDLYEGNLSIPNFSRSTNEYNLDAFYNENGVISYSDSQTYVGIDVSELQGAIDWVTAKESGVQFAMIRIGYRGSTRGNIYEDTQFSSNITAAKEAGIKVGVYFTSQAISVDEAEEEASFVLDLIRDYQLDYPIAYEWKMPSEDDSAARTANSLGIDVSKYAKAFCDRISLAGHKVVVQTTKSLAYTFYDLELLKDYDVWLNEHQPLPSFYYDFPMWQYSSNATVNGIEGPVNINISFVNY